MSIDPSIHARLDTRAVHAGRQDLADLGVHALPLDLSTTNPLPDIERGGASYEAMAGGGRPDVDGGAVYARLWNPTVARFEDALADLEHADGAVAYASGMAAMTAAILAHTTASGVAGRTHVVAVRPLYGGTDHLLASGMLGVTATFCDADDVAASIRPETGLVVLETPGNPTLALVDIADVVAQAASGDRAVPVLVDSTFATPVLQNPLDHGAAMTLHSATKYLGGHGDAVGGIVAGSQETVEALRRVRAVTGALLHPMAAYLLHRGLATLPARVRAQQAGAREVVDFLRTHPAVAAVHYPGLDTDTDTDTDTDAGPGRRPLVGAGAQMRGPGAMVAVRLRGGFDAACALTSAVDVFTHAVSLGGVDSLIQHPAALTHRPVAAEARPTPDLVRLSVGLEDPADLIADLAQALAVASSGGGRAGSVLRRLA